LLRFAHSLTKDLHIRDLRTALLYHIISKQNNEELLIRLDDTDTKNNIEGNEKELLELLTLFGIDHSRVTAQSENIKYHTGMGMKLLLDKKSFNCFCSNEALESDKQKAKKEGKLYSYSGFCETISDETKFQCNAPFVVRMKKPNGSIEINDTLKGKLQFEADQVDSIIILDHDKKPTQVFASAVDDMLHDISFIIQDEQIIINASQETHIRKSLGYDKEINYLHTADILPTQDLTETPSVRSLIKKGYLPIAIANYILQLGYSHPRDIFSIEEAIEWFDIKKLSQETSYFDIEKLKQINQKYIISLDDMRLSKIVGFADEDLGKLAKIYANEYFTTNEIKEKIQEIFSEKQVPSELKEELISLKKCLKNAPFMKEFEDLKKYAQKETNIEESKLLESLSFLLTGSKDEAKLNQIYPFIRNYLGEII